jgi:hypothetical protein
VQLAEQAIGACSAALAAAAQRDEEALAAAALERAKVAAAADSALSLAARLRAVLFPPRRAPRVACSSTPPQSRFTLDASHFTPYTRHPSSGFWQVYLEEAGAYGDLLSEIERPREDSPTPPPPLGAAWSGDSSCSEDAPSPDAGAHARAPPRHTRGRAGGRASPDTSEDEAAGGGVAGERSPEGAGAGRGGSSTGTDSVPCSPGGWRALGIDWGGRVASPGARSKSTASDISI